MGRKSLIESSDHFNDILDMIKKGLKPKDIHDLLLDEFNEDISERTIRRYIGQLKSKTNQEYYKQKKAKEPKILGNAKDDKTKKVNEVVDKGLANKEAVDEVVAKGVSDLDALDNIISEANDLELNIGSLKPQYFDKYAVNTEAEIEKLKIQAKRLAVQAVNAKAKILKDSTGEDTDFVLRIVSDEDDSRIRVEADEETES